jgi:SNF2 family DNA or RNA helicase
MKAHERNDAVIRFQNDKDITIFLIQINTGGQGINLQSANHIYIMSPNWNPVIEHQAIGRAYRNGQTKHVYVTKFCISSGSEKHPYIEENIIKLQEHKKRITANILDDVRLINDGVLHNKGPLANVCKREIEKLFNIT